MKITNTMHIPVYVINLSNRVDRKEHMLKEFDGRNEFAINIVEAIKHKIGAVGLWNTINHILRDLVNNNVEYIVLCEDDHQFTDAYSKENLIGNIDEARKRNADIICGGVSWFNTAVQVNSTLFWVQNFSVLQFTIVFRKFFSVILEANFTEKEVSDHKISNLTCNKFLIHPFISKQKEFGYSDVTAMNQKIGRVDNFFKTSSALIQNLSDVNSFYSGIKGRGASEHKYDTIEDIVIPTYVINLSERTERLDHIKSQFLGKPEFDVTIIDAIKNNIGAVGLWLTIRRILDLAIEREDDVIIICEDDHEFTEHYSKHNLFKSIIECHALGADVVSGGIGYFSQAVPVTSNNFWVDAFYCTQFIVMYRKVFKKILDEPFDDKVTADGILSEITSSKFVLYPFISMQREFGYSDATPGSNNMIGTLTMNFIFTRDRLKMIQYIHKKLLNRVLDSNLEMSDSSFFEMMININNAQLQMKSA